MPPALDLAPTPATGTTVHAHTENRLYFPALDGIRAIALAMVFCQHYLGMVWGYTGVDLFFVLSGFLITGILYDSRNKPDRVRTFYIRRTLRIFPLYYGVLLLLLLLTPLAHFHWNKYWLVWPAYLGNIIRFVHPYSQDPRYIMPANGWLYAGSAPWRMIRIGHFWSLCLEEQFYLLWPAVVFLIRDRVRLLRLCAAVVIAMPVIRVVTMASLPYRYTELELPYSFTPLRIDALLLGALVALLIRGTHRDLTLRAAMWLLRVAVPLIVVYLLCTVRPGHPYPYHYWRLTWGQSIIDVVYTAVIAAALVPGSVVFRIGTLKPLRWLGTISYGLYVFHDLPHWIYSSLAVRASHHIPALQSHVELVTALVGAVGTILLAWISFRFFETPFLNLKERWAPAMKEAPRSLSRVFPETEGAQATS